MDFGSSLKEKVLHKLCMLEHLFDFDRETYYKIYIGFNRNLDLCYFICDKVVDDQDKSESDFMVSGGELVIWTRGDMYETTIDTKYIEIINSMIDEASR